MDTKIKLAYCDFIADRVRKALVNDQWTMQDGENLIDDIGNVQMDLHPTRVRPCLSGPHGAHHTRISQPSSIHRFSGSPDRLCRPVR